MLQLFPIPLPYLHNIVNYIWCELDYRYHQYNIQPLQQFFRFLELNQWQHAYFQYSSGYQKSETHQFRFWLIDEQTLSQHYLDNWYNPLRSSLAAAFEINDSELSFLMPAIFPMDLHLKSDMQRQKLHHPTFPLKINSVSFARSAWQYATDHKFEYVLQARTDVHHGRLYL